MKKTILFFIALISFFELFATHNRGGEITFRRLSVYTYEIVITTYTNSLVQADRDSLYISINNEEFYTLSRVSEEYLGNNYKKNRYTKIHTFPRPGTYIVSMRDPNRNLGILNMPYSVSQVFYLESALIIKSYFQEDYSIDFLERPILQARANSIFRSNIGAHYHGKGKLHYELIPCLVEDGEAAPGYFLPEGIRIDENTGEITWDSPPEGIYSFAVKVSIFDQNEMMAYVVRDFQVDVLNTIEPGTFSVDDNHIEADSTLSFRLDPGDSISRQITYSNNGNYLLELKEFGDVFLVDNPARFIINDSTASAISGIFSWQTDSTHLREAPYVIVFRGRSYTEDSLIENFMDLTFSIYLGPEPVITGGILDLSERVVVFPNPVKDQCTFRIVSDIYPYWSCQLRLYNMAGQEVYRKEKFEQAEFVFKRGQLDPGIYVYTLGAENKTLAFGKIILK